MNTAPTASRRRFLASGLAGCLAPAWGEEAAEAPAPRAERYLGELVKAHHLPGLAVAVQRGGRPVFTRCWGVARPGEAEPVAIDDATRFCIGSLSKPLLAQLVLMLADEGRLGLDDRIGRHLGPVPAHWQGITVRQLLQNTSGLRSAGDPTRPDDMLADPALRRQIQARGGAPFSEAEQLALLQGFSLHAPPGRAFRYSNAGYNVLGSVVGRVTGMPHAEFMRERLFAPLGMTGARMLAADTDFADMAAPCDVTADGRVVDLRGQWLPAQKAFYAGGCGGVQLGLRDLMRWDAGLGGRAPQGAALPPRFTAHLARLPRLWARPVATGGGLGYGLGWTVGRNAAGRLRVGHDGFIPGFRASYLRDPGPQAWSAMVLSHQQAVDPGGVAATLLDLFTGPAA